MSKSKKITFTIFAILFIIYLCLSNIIATAFIPEEKRVTIDKNDILPIKNALACLEDNQYAADRMETAMFKGWIFDKGVHSENKIVQLVFKCENITYRSQPAELSQNTSLHSSLSEFEPDGKENFLVYVSTLPIKNGDYELYIEQNSNGEICRVNTGEVFRKSGVNWYNITPCAPIEPLNADVNVNIITSLMPIKAEKDGLRVEGNVYIKGEENADNEVYAAVKFVSGKELWYPINIKNSIDSVNETRDVRTLHSAFSVLLPTKDMEKGDIEINFIVKRKNKCERAETALGRYTLQ
ncbi:MAG: hypothetical protein RR573_00910 [Oscillospiraceae bacterium]